MKIVKSSKFGLIINTNLTRILTKLSENKSRLGLPPLGEGWVGVCILMIIVIFCLFNQTALSIKKTPIELKWADSLVKTLGDNGNIRNYEGHVSIVQGDVHIKCDKATQYLDANKAELSGNVILTQEKMNLYTPKGLYDGNSKIATAYNGVKIIEDSTVLTADNGTYSTETNIADFVGNVKIVDDSAIIYSDRIIYHRSNRNSFAYGNVLIQGRYTNTLLRGDTINHYPNQNLTYIYGKPILYQIDTVKNKNDSLVAAMQEKPVEYKFDTLCISSVTMEAHRSGTQEFYYFRDSVEICRDHISSKSDSAEYDKLAEIIKLRGKPVVWYDSTQLYADSIIIYVPNKKLSRIESYNNALAATRSDTLFKDKINQIIGNKILIIFEKDTINTICSYGNAKSLYFSGSGESDEGAARNSADTLFVNFVKGEPDNIKWLGGVQGEFFPGNLLMEPKMYYLPLFKWSDTKPKKKFFSRLNVKK